MSVHEVIKEMSKRELAAFLCKELFWNVSEEDTEKYTEAIVDWLAWEVEIL